MGRKMFLLSMGMAILSLSASAQFTSENATVKIEHLANSGIYTVVKVTNKQNCNGVYRIVYGFSNRAKTINHQSSDTFHIVPPTGGMVYAKADYYCNGQLCFDIVQIDVDNIALPVKFVSFKSTPIGNRKVLVEYQVAESTDVKQYNVQLSYDGVTWNTAQIVFPDGLKPDKLYSVILDLTKKP